MTKRTNKTWYKESEKTNASRRSFASPKRDCFFSANWRIHRNDVRACSGIVPKVTAKLHGYSLLEVIDYCSNLLHAQSFKLSQLNTT